MFGPVNCDPVTKVHFGVIPASQLEDWVLEHIMDHGVDIHYQDAVSPYIQMAEDECLDLGIEEEHRQDWIIERADQLMAEDMDEWYDPEPEYEFGINGVVGSTFWMGGAQHLMITASPCMGEYLLCSPCCPNAGDLMVKAQPMEGYITYDVPAHWRLPS